MLTIGPEVDILILTETWLSEALAQHLTIPGFTHHHYCRAKRGGRTVGGGCPFF